MPSTVDPNNILPRYYQLINIIKGQIDSKKWKPHEPIPSERQLEEIYNVSRTTIRQALDILTRQGYLYREHGRGTFVSPQKLQKGINELTSFTEDMLKRGLKPASKNLNLELIEPPADVAAMLDIHDKNQKVYKIERLRLADNQPMGLQTSYLLLSEGQEITEADLGTSKSLYRLLQEKFNLIPTEADETLEVTVASEQEAQLLQVPEGSPLLLSERILFSQFRRPLEFVKILYRGDRYKYYARLTR